ncbi:hypothetical protein ACFORG_17975 [Lutimaribacter marinistellae]|uniref:Transcriptional regulator n=1 Tax=Lutimaribacter marinistellae TaxID=1820329 RepID=A0ABV7TL38_9RHOB
MRVQLTPDKIEDLRKSLEQVYARPFDEAEALEIAERMYALYEELKTL